MIPMNNQKMKYTNQRVEILNFLKDNTTHPTVEEVFEGVRKKLTRISKATVYQNLKMLTRKGIIQEVNVKGVSRFEPNMEPHHHIICRKCGRIFDFKSPELTRYSMKVARQLKQVDVDAAFTNFYCKECKGVKPK
jgi:Fur family ferric uptake transcriptional regulator